MTNAQRATYNRWRRTPEGEAYENAVLRFAPTPVYIELVKPTPEEAAKRAYVAGVVGRCKIAHFYVHSQ